MKKKETRGAHGSGTIRKRSDGRWEGRYTLGRDPGTGKQIQKSVYAKTEAEVRKKLTKICAQIDDNTYNDPVNVKLVDWLNRWIKDFSSDKKPLTIEKYESDIKNHIRPALGNVKLKDLTMSQIQKFCNNLTNEKGLSPKTVKNIHGVLHKALEQAVNLKFIPKNPADGCVLPRYVKKPPTVIDQEKIVDFLEGIKVDPHEDLYIFTIFSGLRQSEVIGLTWDCVDLKNGLLYVYRQYQRQKKGFNFEDVKHDKTRYILLPSFLVGLLKKVRKKQEIMRQKAGQYWQNKQCFIFTNEIGKPFVHETVRVHFKKALKRAGLPETIRFHDLRHTFAALSLSLGDDVKTVQEHLGHQSAAFTMNTYIHMTNSMQEASAERLNLFFESIDKQKQ